MTEADAAARAATIESELQTSIDEAKADVAKEAQSDEEKRVHEERLTNLERQLADVRAGQTAAPVVTEPVVQAPAAPVEDDRIGRLEQTVAEIRDAVIKKPVEAVADAAGAVVDTVKDAGEGAAEVVESIPKRTHSLFARPFSRHD